MAWGTDEDTDRETGNRPDHVIAVNKDGVWYAALAQRPEFAALDGGRTIGVTLKDRQGRIVVESRFERPWPGFFSWRMDRDKRGRGQFDGEIAGA